MKKIILILFLGTTFLSQTKAQKFNYPYVNKLTYSQYLNKDWKNLIRTGKKSLKQGIDFFFLRSRMGIAYFELGKYGLAINEFQKALQMNSDDYLKKSLYYSYLYAGRLTDAYSLAQKFSHELKEEVGQKHKLQNIEFSLFNENMSYSSLMITDINGTDNLSASQEITKNRFSPKISLSFAQKNGRSLLSYQFLHSSNIYRLQEDTGKIKNFETTLNQHRFYYFKSFRLNKRLNLNYGLNLIPGTGQYYDLQTVNSNSMFKKQEYVKNSYNYLDWQVAGGMTYKSAFYKIDIDAAYGNFGAYNYAQIEILPSIYPFANLNLYISPKFIIQFNESNIYGLSIGTKIFSKLWIQFDYLNANNTNFSTDIGNFVYNSSERINNLLTLNLIFPLNKVELTLSYVLEHKEVPYYYTTSSSLSVTKYLAESANLFYISFKF